MNHLPSELLAAAGDAIARALGAPVAREHPVAHSMQATPLSMVARAAALAARPSQPHESDAAIMARGMGTSDFSAAIAVGAKHLIRRRFDAQAQHRAFCTTLECRNFRPEPLPAVDIGLDLPRTTERGEITHGHARVFVGPSAQSARLLTYSSILGVTRQAIVNDELGLVSALLSSFAGATARVEAKLVYAALEANTVLDDGAPAFHADLGNVITDPFGETTLAQAVAALRRQLTASGDQADLAARHLVVAPELEVAARKLNRDLDLGLVITAGADLPAARWYVLADPEIQPVVATLRLRGTADNLRVEPAKKAAADLGFDGLQVRGIADLGAAVVGRVGIIRGGA